MKIFKMGIITISIILLFVASGCVFVPKAVPEQEDGLECNLITKELTLESKNLSNLNFSGGGFSSCNKPACILAIPLAFLGIAGGSAIVSGSIVLVGNTVHWVEQQGRCDQSTTKRVTNKLITSTKKVGGKLVESSEELALWFQQILDKPNDTQEDKEPVFAKCTEEEIARMIYNDLPQDTINKICSTKH